MVFYTRRPDLTPKEFRTYMEEKHMPVVKEVMGDLYPVDYIRRYVLRVDSGAGDRLGAPAASRRSSDTSAPVVLVGAPSELGWDMMGEMVFKDELHLQQNYAIINGSEGQRIKDDEENFTIPHLLKVVILGETTNA